MLLKFNNWKVRIKLAINALSIVIRNIITHIR